MASRTFTVTVEAQGTGGEALLSLLTPVNVARGVRDFMQESMAPGQAVAFRVTASDEMRSHTFEGRVPSPEEIRARIESLRREAEQNG